jgi:hypothetical protein
VAVEAVWRLTVQHSVGHGEFAGDVPSDWALAPGRVMQ